MLCVGVLVTFLLYINAPCVASVTWGPPPTTSLVHDNINWAKFLSTYDLLYEWELQSSNWSYLPTSWLQGPYTGNGWLGQVMYACDPPPGGQGRGGLCWNGNATDAAELRMEMGRMDLYSARNPEKGQFWDGIRLPVGYLRFTLGGARMLGGTMRLTLHTASIAGTIRTSNGTLWFRVYTHATRQLQVVEWNITHGTLTGLHPVWVPLTKCVDRWDVAGLPSCTLRPNPPAVCHELSGGERVCRQRMDTADQGSFATALKQVQSSGTSGVILLSVASAMWPYNISSDPEVPALAVVREAAGIGVGGLRAEHEGWWSAYWPSSFLSTPETKTDGFYWMEMYRLGSSCREDGPMRDELGPWYVDSEWPGMWYDLNTEMTYIVHLASNRVPVGRSLGNALVANARNGHLHNNVVRSGGVLSKFNDTMGVGASSNQMHVSGDSADLMWVTSNVWMQCEAEYDPQCYIDLLLPPLRGALGTYSHLVVFHLNGTATPGTLHVPPSDLPAYPHPPGWDCSFDVATLRFGLKVFIDVCRRLLNGEPPFHLRSGPVPSECDFLSTAEWIFDRLTHLHVDPLRGINAFYGVPFTEATRHFDHLLAFIPLQLYSYPDSPLEIQRACVNTIDNFYRVTWGGHAESTFSWPVVAQGSACVGRADAAWGNLTAVLFDFGSITPNTFDNEGDNVPSARQIINMTPEGTASAADTLHTFLLQSYNDVIRIFPSIPTVFPSVVFYRLRAFRGFLVSGRWKEGRTCWAQIESLKGAQPLVFTLPVSKGVKLIHETHPPGLNVTVVGAGASDTGRKFRVTGIGAGHTVLVYPVNVPSCGPRSEFRVDPLPVKPEEVNYWGYREASPAARAWAKKYPRPH